MDVVGLRGWVCGEFVVLGGYLVFSSCLGGGSGLGGGKVGCVGERSLVLGLGVILCGARISEWRWLSFCIGSSAL